MRMGKIACVSITWLAVKLNIKSEGWALLLHSSPKETQVFGSCKICQI